MRNKVAFPFFILFLLTIFSHQTQASNLLSNPSFETGDKSGWNGRGQVVKAVAVAGEHSVRIFGDTSNWHTLKQPVDVLPGGIYRFSGNLRAWNMSTGNYQFHIRWYDENGAELKNERRYFGTTTSSGTYSKHVRDLMVPANAVTASFRLTANKADGVGYFDAMSIVLLEAPTVEEEVPVNTVTKNLLTNGSFESGDKNGWSGSGTVINVGAQEGKHALRFFGNADRWLSLSQNVAVEARKKYTLSGHIKTGSMTQGAYRLQIRWYDNNGHEISGTRYNFAAQSYNSSNYKAYSSEVIAPAGATVAALRIQANQADGHAVIDNLTLETKIPLPPLVSSVQPNRTDLESQYAFDGDMSTRWSSEFADPQWITKDLESTQTVAGVNLHWQTAYGKAYEIQVSNDLLNWNTVYFATNGDGGLDEVRFDSPVDARYVRMYGTERGTQWGFSLWEFEVVHFIEDPMVSSTQPNRSDLDAANVFDGDMNTRWSSDFADNQWITKDMGSVTSISAVSLHWENAFGKSYEIQVSNDRFNWSTVYQTTQGDGGLDVITFPSVEARYVRMYGTERGTQYGFSLWEFEVNPVYADPIVNFSAANLEVNPGETTTLSWSTSHATSCEAGGAWSGSQNLSGVMTTDALLSDSFFILTCSNVVGVTASQTVLVSVALPDPQALVIQNANASDFDSARDRFPSNAIDGDTNSKWTAIGTSNWITLDLGATQLVSQTRMSIYVGGVADFRYSVAVSTDNMNWNEVFSNGLLSLRPDWTVANFNPTEARYVRVTLTTPVSNYINLYDFEVHGHVIGELAPIDPIDPPPPPAPVLDTLSWNANTDAIDGYAVYHGATATTASTEFVSVSLTTSGFNANAPAVQYDAINELGYAVGSQVCFRVRAYVGSVYSNWSEAVCDTVD